MGIARLDKAEMFAGALRSNNPARSLKRQQTFFARFVSLPFDDAAARHYADIRDQLETRGLTIGPNDLMIAAIARIHDLILVSNNKEFERVSGLAVEDWSVKA